MPKIKFQVFSRVNSRIPENYKNHVYEGDMHNFRKFRIFWELLELNQTKNDRMLTGTDGRTDKLQITI